MRWSSKQAWNKQLSRLETDKKTASFEDFQGFHGSTIPAGKFSDIS